jgi:hypothetical protein
MGPTWMLAFFFEPRFAHPQEHVVERGRPTRRSIEIADKGRVGAAHQLALE